MSPLSSDRLLALVLFQTEIVKARMDVGSVIARAAELSQTLTDADGAAIELAEGEEMVYRAASGLATKQLGLRIPRKGSLSGKCVEMSEILTCEDSEEDPRVDRVACRAVGLRSMIVVPLKHEERAIGVLKVLSRSPRAFSSNDAQALHLLSEAVGASLGQATEHASKVEELEVVYQLATRDALTGLANRALFYDRLHQSLALARRNRQALGLALLDMDGLKRINDTLGHRAGDAAIRALAEWLKGAVRATDTPARLGGDEFGVLLPNVQDREAARRVGLKLSEQLAGPFTFEGNTYPLGASVGLAIFPDDGEDVETLIGLADAAMYDDKRARKAGRVD